MLFQMLLQNGESKYAFCAKISVEFLFLFYFQKQFTIANKNEQKSKKKNPPTKRRWVGKWLRYLISCINYRGVNIFDLLF